MIMREKAIRCSIVLFMAVAALNIAGCRTLKAPLEPSREWDAPRWEKTSRADDDIWKSLRSGEVDPSIPLSLAELVVMALENNPGTREAWQAARMAEAEARQAENGLYPRVTVSGNITKGKKIANRHDDILDQMSYGPGGKITYMLFDFGARSAAIKEARQALLASNFSFNQALHDLIFEIQKAYYGLFSAKSAFKAAEFDAYDAQMVFKLAEEKFAAGIVAKLDVLQARAGYDDAMYMLEEARGAAENAKAGLAGILGLPADTGFDIADPPEEAPPEINLGDIRALIDDAMGKRPDIQAERAMLRAKEEAVKAAGSALWPTLNAAGSVEADWYEYYGALRKQKNKDKEDYSYTGYISVEWDIFDGFYNFNAKRAAERDRDGERERLRRDELAASTDVWTKYHDYNTAMRKFTFSRAFLDTAEEAYDLAMESYNAGLKSMIDLIQAQSQLSDARSKLVQSKEDLFVAIAGLAHATGALNVPERPSEPGGPGR
ncbi:MAG: TolC family protein [Candidatus Omnitrophota bacterium]